jgi:L-cystine transport system permease protein
METIHFVKIFTYIPELLPFLFVTMEYVILSMFFGSVLGFILALAKLGRNKIWKSLANVYTTILRCTPSIVLLFLLFYSIPVFIKSIFDLDIGSSETMVVVVITFSLFLGASLSEIMRSSYEAIEQGQYEAAMSIGFTTIQALRRIVLPQAFYVALPNIGNTILYLMKEGALAFTIGLVDLMGKGYQINSETLGGYVLEVYIALAIIYWTISIGVERIFKKLEISYGLGSQCVKVSSKINENEKMEGTV